MLIRLRPTDGEPEATNTDNQGTDVAHPRADARVRCCVSRLPVATLLVFLGLTAPASAALVFERPPPVGAPELQGGAIFAARNDGSGAHLIAHGRAPVVSPDGLQVAYFVNTHSDERLWIVPVRGGRARRVIADPVFPLGPGGDLTWSPDSRRLVVADAAVPGAFIVDVRRGSRQFIPLDFQDGGASFSSDSSTAVIDNSALRTSSLVTVRIGERRARLLTSDGESPVWGRAGIAFVRRPTIDTGRVLLEARPGAPTRVVLDRRAHVLFPVAWADGGRRLLVASASYPEKFRAEVVAPATRTVRTLSATFSAVDGLSRDGRVVLGEAGGDVIAVSPNNDVETLATGATAATWTR